jgi:peptide/nickel transport system permease protein
MSEQPPHLPEEKQAQEANDVNEHASAAISESKNFPSAGILTSPAIEVPGFEGLSPARLAWRRLRRNRTAVIGAFILIALYLITLSGSFIEPYNPSQPDLVHSSHPPMLPRFVDEHGKFHFRPFVYGMREVDMERKQYAFDLSQRYPIQFFCHGDPYKLWWIIPSDLHLFGVQAPGKIFLLGADAFGCDVFSRVIEGGKVSLSIGLIGIALSLAIGMFMGGLAGYFGGLTDVAVMRLVEFLLSIPTLYLIIAMRAYFQTEGFLGLGGRDETIGSGEIYFIIIVILSLIGWAAQARVIRGMVLSIKEQDFVLAERALGASTFRIITRHILPNTMSYVIVSATIAIPGYILGEVALSFLGVGIQDPQVSWGIMLNKAQSVDSMENMPWLLLTPAVAIFLTVFAFNFVGDGLRDALDPRHSK